MKKIFIILVLFLNTFLTNAQNVQEQIDILKKELNDHPNVKRQASIYSDLTWYYSNISVDSALFYGNKAIEFSKKIKDEALLSQIYSDLGSVYFRNGSFEKSKEFYNKSLALRLKNKDYNGVAKVNINLASILTSRQNFSEATKYYLKAISYFEKKDDTICSITKSNLAAVFLNMRNFTTAKKYINEAIEFQKNNDLNLDLGRSYLILGNIYSGQNQNQNAIDSYKLSIELALKSNDYVSATSGYHNIGSLYLDIGKYKSALYFYENSRKYLQLINSDLDKAIFEINIGRCYLLNTKYSDAKNILLKNKKLLEDERSNIELSNTYKWLSKSYSFLKQPDSADYYLEKYINLNNDIINDKNIKQTSELETKYQTAKKEKLLVEKEAENKRKNYWIIIISILTVFTSLVGFLIFRQQKLKNKQQEQEFELKAAIAQIETQNQLQEQRLSISRDLHDNIGAQLTFVISSVDNLKFGNQIKEEKVVNQLTKISDFTKSTIVELRDTIWAMNNNEFSFDDLRSRIYNFIEKAQSAKEDIVFKFNVNESLNDIKFSSIVGINLYRTIQEAINNAVKYSEATEILVNVKTSSNKIQIEIQDNGKGFDIETVDFGNGLTNMKKRIEEVDGIIEIITDVGKGTVVSILI